MPWPNIYLTWARGGHPADLDSQQASQSGLNVQFCGFVLINAPPQSKKCDGTTIYQAGFTLNNPNIVAIAGTSSTDNELLLELLGDPYNSNLCTSPYWCMRQDYKAHTYDGSPGKANFNYTLSLSCNPGPPPGELSLAQAFSCQ